MKITLITSLYGIEGGGAGIIIHHLARGLQKEGFQVSIITLGGSNASSVIEQDKIRIYQIQPINLYQLNEKDVQAPWKKIVWQLIDIYNFHSAEIIRKILKVESPDIVHIHKMRGFSGAIWSTAARELPGRVIQTCHDYESMSPDGLLRGSVGRMALRRQWPVRGYQLIRAKLSKGISIVTAPSAHTLNRVKASGLFPSAQTKVVPNSHGWSTNELISLQKEIKVSKFEKRFLFMGRLELEKGIVELCEAFLQNDFAHGNFHLDIAGSGTLEADLRRRYDNQPRIRFWGRVEGERKWELLRRACVVIVPSLVEEVFGLTVVEAFSVGKPVIASKIGGLQEVVKHSETGWLVKAGDIHALAEQLRSVANLDPGVLALMSHKCMLESRQFSLDTVLNEYVALYRRMIG